MIGCRLIEDVHEVPVIVVIISAFWQSGVRANSPAGSEYHLPLTGRTADGFRRAR